MRTAGPLRTLALAAATVGLIAPLAACGSSDSGGSGGDDPTKLVVYSAEPASVDGYKEALEPFEEANDVTVEIVSYPSDQFLTQFPNAVRAKSQIDALLVNGQDVRTLVAKDLLAPLGDAVDPSSMIDPAITPFTLDGEQYAVGVNTMYTTGVAVNTDLMTKYGLVEPKTFADLEANVAKLQGTDVSLFSVPGSNIYLWPIWFMQTLEQSSGADPLALTQQTVEGSTSFTAPEYVEAMAALQRLGTMNLFQPGYAGVDQDGANATMVQGKAVMFYGGTWDISAISDQATFPLEVTTFPTYVDGVVSKPAGGAAIAAALYADVDESRKDLATKLVQYLTSVDGQEATLVATKAGFPLPTAKGVEVESSPTAKEVAATLAPETFTFLDWYWPKEVTAAFQQAIPATVAGKQQPADAMADVQKAFEAAQASGWTY